jgi:phosphohistidine phosphatase SixA
MHHAQLLTRTLTATGAPADGSATTRRALCLKALAVAAGTWGGWLIPATPAWAAEPEAHFWQQLDQGACVVLMRHALTDPGTGDPAGFDLKNCATQRNLNEAGRRQARDWGAAFVQHRVALSEVRTSGWCRCKDTARLAFGRYRVWSPLNSFFEDPATGTLARTQTADVVRFIESLRTPRNTVLVTHQVNITALTGETPAMGEMLLVRPSHTPSPGAPGGPHTPPYPVVARLSLPS